MTGFGTTVFKKLKDRTFIKMVQAYFFDNKNEIDAREPHCSGELVGLDQLSRLGVFYRFIHDDDEVDALAKERNYKNRDVVNISRASFQNDEQAMLKKLEVFYEEHIHEDEEIRYCLDGEGYFDLKDPICDRWIRVKVCKGDLLVVPAGIYHRFMLTTQNYIKAMRLFQDEPKWLAINKPDADANAARKQYLASISSNT